MGSCGPRRDFSSWLPSRGMNQQQRQRKKKKENKDLHKDEQHNGPRWSFSRCIFWRWQQAAVRGGRRGGVDTTAKYLFFFFRITMCARVCHYVGRVGPPDRAPSLMYVCLQPPPTHTHHRAEMRSDSVMNVSAACVNVCVCVCISHPFWLSLVVGIRVCVCVCVCVRACLARLPPGHGWSPQRVAWLADRWSCLHCIRVPSEEEQTPCRL